MIALQRELSGLFQLCGMKEVDIPPEDILMDYDKLQNFRQQLTDDKIAKKTAHTNGWKVV